MIMTIPGDYDYGCNWIGNYNWAEALEWSGQKAFVAEELREWKANDTATGQTKSAKGLSFATVHRAGHMVRLGFPLLYY